MGTGVVVNKTKTVALPPPAEIALLGGIGVNVAARDGVVVVGVPAGSNAFVGEHALSVVTDNRLEGLALLLARMPDKPSVVLVASKAFSAKHLKIERVVDVRLSSAACERPDHTASFGCWSEYSSCRPQATMLVFCKIVAPQTA